MPRVRNGTKTIVEANLLTCNDIYGRDGYIISLLKEKGGALHHLETDKESPQALTAEFIAQKKTGRSRLERLTTVVFDDERQWAQFLEYAFHDFKGSEGLAFTDSSLPMSVRVGPDLLDAAHERFPMRLVRPQEEERYLNGLKGDRPFHPDTYKDRHIPAVDFFERVKRSK